MRIPASICRALAILGGIALLALVPAGIAARPGATEALFLFCFVAPLYATGLFAYRKRPDLAVAQLLLAVGSLWVLAECTYAVLEAIHEEQGLVAGLWPVGILAEALSAAAFVLSAALIALLPDGLYRRRYERWAIGAMWLVLLGPAVRLLTSPTVNVVPSSDSAVNEVTNPLAISGLSGIADLADAVHGIAGVLPLIAVAMLAVRYRRLAVEQRLQVRWPLFILAAGVLGAGSLFTLGRVDPAFGTAGIVVAFAAFALLPVSILLAIFRYRLLEVDLLIRRSLVYGVLWLLIAAVYVGAAAALGIAAGERLPVAVAVLLAVIATLLFQPARQRLERLADRWVFGERLGRYEALTAFGAELERTLDPQVLLQRLVETAQRGLDARWSRVLLRAGGHAGALEPRAATGIEIADDEAPALSAELQSPAGGVGMIECGPRREGEYTSADASLLENLARQAGLAIENAGLASELAARLDEIRRQAADLAASRARIVQVQEAERRRIERNIHDGVQQTLVALIAKLRLARNQLDRDPGAAGYTLGELQDEAGVVLADLRELAQGIHPSVLSDSGLWAAIESRAAVTPLTVSVNADPGFAELRFGDEVEGAAYFVVSEGLANALKHAEASRVEIGLSHDGQRLTLSIEDDGVGLPPDAPRRGLANLEDRVAALGGQMTVRSERGRGTTLECVLPAQVRELAHV